MNQAITFGEADLTALRETVREQMSPKRFHHTAAVEDMAVRLATLYCPEEIPALRAAALLHDITKEYDIPTHMALLTEAGQPPERGEEYAHKTSTPVPPLCSSPTTILPSTARPWFRRCAGTPRGGRA